MKKPLKSKIFTDETLKEKDSHGSIDYPFCYYLEDIWDFDFHCIDWHWHPEVEFVYLKKGKSKVFVGSTQYTLREGEGIFINAEVIHRFESGDHAIIPNIVFSPYLLAAKENLIFSKYIQPILDSSIECQIFSKSVSWQNEIIQTLLSVFEIQESKNQNEMQTVQLLLNLWNEMFRNLQDEITAPLSKSNATAKAKLQIMMQYIHKNYKNPISLEDIAKTVNLSKSSVLNIFNNYLYISPVNYLIRYRLRCAAKLLNTTQSSVSYIAENTGFDNIGYFCRKFKELYKVTPSEYRKMGMPEKQGQPHKVYSLNNGVER